MRLAIALEYRFHRHADGSVWTSSAYGRKYWDRYLRSFDRVLVVARAEPVNRVHDGWIRVDDATVEVARLPYYVGPWAYLRCRRRLVQAIRGSLGREDALVLRMPGAIGPSLLAASGRGRRPYGLEVVGDPAESLGPAAVRSPLRPLLRRWAVSELRRRCRDAAAVLYVTQWTLQQRYPPGPATSAQGVSDVALGEEDLRERQSHAVFVASSVELGPDALVVVNTKSRGLLRNLVCVAAMEQPYKGQDVLLAAMAECRTRGLHLRLTLVGDGRERPRLEALTGRLGLEDTVRFMGYLPAGAAVRSTLGEADLFVLPSRVDAMPRALLEAMAMGLPCLATSVGGIPEVLPPEALVLPGDARALAERLRSIAAQPDLLRVWGHRNHLKALAFRDSVLQEVREDFYQTVIEATRGWLRDTR